MNKFTKALILGLILVTPTVVVIPEVQAQNTPPAKTEPVDTVEQKTTPVRKIYTEDASPRRNRKKPTLTRTQIRKITRKKNRRELVRQQRRQASRDAVQNFGKPLIPGR